MLIHVLVVLSNPGSAPAPCLIQNPLAVGVGWRMLLEDALPFEDALWKMLFGRCSLEDALLADALLGDALSEDALWRMLFGGCSFGGCSFGGCSFGGCSFFWGMLFGGWSFFWGMLFPWTIGRRGWLRMLLLPRALSAVHQCLVFRFCSQTPQKSAMDGERQRAWSLWGHPMARSTPKSILPPETGLSFLCQVLG